MDLVAGKLRFRVDGFALEHVTAANLADVNSHECSTRVVDFDTGLRQRFTSPVVFVRTTTTIPSHPSPSSAACTGGLR